MDRHTIEPRRVMWAVAEVSWDAEGMPNRAPATIEDMSASGACIRVKSPIRVGSRVMVKWHREQFSATARNCRRDGVEFLLGVRRDGERGGNPSPEATGKNVARSAGGRGASDVVGGDVASLVSTRSTVEVVPSPKISPTSRSASASRETSLLRSQPDHRQNQVSPLVAVPKASRAELARSEPSRCEPSRSEPVHPKPASVRPAQLQPEGSSARRERKAMPGKTLFPQFWRRQPEPDAPQKPKSTEAPVNKPNDHAAETDNGPRLELLSYEDIYHAAGIMSPRSGYGIHKVVEMLNSERIRDLSKDVKRASVLMALEAAGALVDELQQDAARRQHALNSYEEAQRKQLEEFETRKTQENAKIQAEMERLAAHYAERIQRNRDLVAREKEALHNWQMAKQHESQRISDVMELCARPPAGVAMAAAAGQGADAPRDAAPRTALLPEVPGRS